MLYDVLFANKNINGEGKKCGFNHIESGYVKTEDIFLLNFVTKCANIPTGEFTLQTIIYRQLSYKRYNTQTANVNLSSATCDTINRYVRS